MPDVPVAPEPDPLPPTIFPFAEGRPDAPPASAYPFSPGPEPVRPDDAFALSGLPPTGDDGPAAPWGDTQAPADGEPLWPSTWPADQAPTDGADTLWPSTWPADQPGDAPAWAAPPVTDGEIEPPTGAESQHAAPGAPWAEGGDGGSIGDLPGFSAGNGDHGAAPAAAFDAIQRPPELDELPSWYTDPLPNAPGGAPANGAASADGAPSAPWAVHGIPDSGADWPSPGSPDSGADWPSPGTATNGASSRSTRHPRRRPPRPARGAVGPAVRCGALGRDAGRLRVPPARRR